MKQLLLLFTLLTLSTLIGLSSCVGNRTILIGPGFWNVRASFVIDGLDIGTQMSLIQLKSGKFLILDTVQLDSDLLKEINSMTNNGSLMEAVIATHPFHTVFFPDFYKQFPKVPYYGTPRHIKNQPQIPWAGSMWDCENREKWLPEVHMRIPRGSEFVDPQPEETNHFSGINVFHAASRTIHVDDTIMIEPIVGMIFHPTLVYHGLYHIPEAPTAFKHWVSNMIKQWDFDNICAAHNGIQKGGAKTKLKNLLSITTPVLDVLVVDYYLTPDADDEAAYQVLLLFTK